MHMLQMQIPVITNAMIIYNQWSYNSLTIITAQVRIITAIQKARFKEISKDKNGFNMRFNIDIIQLFNCGGYFT